MLVTTLTVIVLYLDMVLLFKAIKSYFSKKVVFDSTSSEIPLT